MSKSIPSVSKYMSTQVQTIGKDQTISQAHRLLREHHFRHLPVLDGNSLVGLLSDRDLGLIEALRDVDPNTVTVEEAMSQVVYTVTPDSPLDEVVGEMAEHKYGSAIVMQNGKVVGIFTTVDVCVALADLLHTRLK